MAISRPKGALHLCSMSVSRIFRIGCNWPIPAGYCANSHALIYFEHHKNRGSICVSSVTFLGRRIPGRHLADRLVGLRRISRHFHPGVNMPQKGIFFRSYLVHPFLLTVSFAICGEAATRVAVLPLSHSPELKTLVPRLVRHEVELRLAHAVQIVQSNAHDIERAVGVPWHTSYQLSPGIIASVARTLGTSAALYGSVFKTGSDVRITLGLVDAESGESVIEVSRKSAPDSASIVSAAGLMGEILKNRAESFSGNSQSRAASSVMTMVSIPEGARLSIDGDFVGTTPYADSGFSPGVHRIALEADRYEHFEKEIDFPAGQPRKIKVRMRPKYGGIMVLGTPTEAVVKLGDTLSGSIPFHHDTLVPGAYQLSVSSPAYESYASQINIERGRVDTLEVSLVTQAHIDSLQHVKRLRRRTARRITFGAFGVVLAGAGLLVNREIVRRAGDAEAAYDRYKEPGLTASEYDSRYNAYRDAHEEIAEPEGARNFLYFLAGLSAVGFAVSIPF